MILFTGFLNRLDQRNVNMTKKHPSKEITCALVRPLVIGKEKHTDATLSVVTSTFSWYNGNPVTPSSEAMMTGLYAEESPQRCANATKT